MTEWNEERKKPIVSRQRERKNTPTFDIPFWFPCECYQRRWFNARSGICCVCVCTVHVTRPMPSTQVINKTNKTFIHFEAWSKTRTHLKMLMHRSDGRLPGVFFWEQLVCTHKLNISLINFHLCGECARKRRRAQKMPSKHEQRDAKNVHLHNLYKWNISYAAIGNPENHWKTI